MRYGEPNSLGHRRGQVPYFPLAAMFGRIKYQGGMSCFQLNHLASYFPVGPFIYLYGDTVVVFGVFHMDGAVQIV